ncbi:nuclear transport factor 2 family protein [Deinococcus sp.]|uniref:nuclear transport factor 2 family protein n=1 Tax=Deinococcus sp. TaxID=47478 RepID=UPI003C7EB260
MDTFTQNFMQALQRTEQSRDPAPLVALFSEVATLHNLTTQTWEGLDGAHAFWTAYLGNFEQIRSEFSHHTDDGHTGVMEWEATGQLKGGHDLSYRGVSIIEHDGQKVQAFRTYYDSAAFIRPESA